MGDISRLPENIIHHILSYMDTNEAARPSIFCKTWYNAWLTCPTLSFDETFQSMKGIYQRYRDHKIHIEEMSFCMTISDTCTVSHVDQWIDLAIENGVKLLQLDFSVEYPVEEYTLPRIIFQGKSLRELDISGVPITLNKRVDDKVMFYRLQILRFTSITIDDDTFEGIIAGCPLIESIDISSCRSLKRIRVTKLYKLEELTTCAHWEHSVDIEASNLRYLDCSLNGGSLKLYNTETLKSLALYGPLPSETFLENLGHKFPQIEDLTLFSLSGQRRINISSHSLENIVLYLTPDLREVNIDAPNMVSLKLYDITYFPYLSLTNAPSQWELKIAFCCLDADHFCKMKQFLSKVIRSKITLYLSWYVKMYNLVEIQKIPICPIVEVEDVQLDFWESTPSADSNFLDALFLTCHPKVIIVNDYRHTPDLLFKNLIERRNEDCRIHETKSWYRELKDVRLEIYDTTNHQWLPSDGKSLAEAPEYPLNVYFRLQWESTS